MQEEYRPRHIKYSICFPKWGTPSHQGVLPTRSDGGGGYPRWDTPPPGREYPLARSDRGYLRLGTPQQGVTPPVRSNGEREDCPMWGTPQAGGNPPQPGPRGDYPRWGTRQQGYPWGWTWLGLLPAGVDSGTPLGVDRQMDRQMSKHYLPSYLFI